VVSHHLGRLRREGFIKGRRDGNVVFASLTARGRAVIDLLSAAVA
jgi:DNA-binding transcriptional ArsR family regulator